MYEFSYPSRLPGSTNDPVSHGQGKKSYGSIPMQKRGRMGTEEEWMGQGPPRHVVTPGQDSVDKWKSCHEDFHGISWTYRLNNCKAKKIKTTYVAILWTSVSSFWRKDAVEILNINKVVTISVFELRIWEKKKAVKRQRYVTSLFLKNAGDTFALSLRNEGGRLRQSWDRASVLSKDEATGSCAFRLF